MKRQQFINRMFTARRQRTRSHTGFELGSGVSRRAVGGRVCRDERVSGPWFPWGAVTGLSARCPVPSIGGPFGWGVLSARAGGEAIRGSPGLSRCQGSTRRRTFVLGLFPHLPSPSVFLQKKPLSQTWHISFHIYFPTFLFIYMLLSNLFFFFSNYNSHMAHPFVTFFSTRFYVSEVYP